MGLRCAAETALIRNSRLGLARSSPIRLEPADEATITFEGLTLHEALKLAAQKDSYLTGQYRNIAMLP